MAEQRRPKVLVFDMGGVCVVSPFQAILDYELAHGIPAGYINYSISKLAPNGYWHRLERGEILCDADYFRGFKADLERRDTWEEYHRRRQAESPPVPSIDAEAMYWTMMTHARAPDPYMYPALLKLQAHSHYHLAGLSNTTIFPEGHPLLADRPDDPRKLMEVFVSSAHVGMRKPHPDIYRYCLRLLQEKWPQDDIQPEDIVFLDDIGENLKTARKLGWRTIRVVLGKTKDAVRELEQVTGLNLLEGGSGSGAKL